MKSRIQERRFNIMKQRSHPRQHDADRHNDLLTKHIDMLDAHAIEVEVAARWQNKTLEELMLLIKTHIEKARP